MSTDWRAAGREREGEEFWRGRRGPDDMPPDAYTVAVYNDLTDIVGMSGADAVLMRLARLPEYRLRALIHHRVALASSTVDETAAFPEGGES